jgi:hypothetical protein
VVQRRAAKQAFLVALASALFAAWARPSLSWLLVAYLLALLIWQLFGRSLEALRSRQLYVLAGLLALPALSWAYHARARIATQEGLFGASERFFDRLRLQSEPALAPPLLSTDRPQSFFVNAPGTRRLRVRFLATESPRDAQALGAGLFRIDYDPRASAKALHEGPLTVQLELDGQRIERSLQVVEPLPHPRWFCVSPSRTAAATPSEETDELIVSADHALLRIATGDGPVDCAWLDEQHVVVSHRFEAALWVIDVAQRKVARTVPLTAAAARMALSPDRSRLVVAQLGRTPQLTVWLVPELRELARVPLAEAADWLVFGSDADSLLVSLRGAACLQRWARSGDGYALAKNLQLGRPALTLARSRDGARAWLATTDFRPDGRRQLGNHFVQDQLLTVDTASLRVLERRLSARRSERQSKPGDVDQGASPMGLAELSDGTLAVSFAGSDALGRLDPQTQDFTMLDLAPSGVLAPHGVAELVDGSLLLSSPVAGALAWLGAGARPVVLPLGPSDAQLRTDRPAALRRRIGEHAFYEGTRSGISCQSCHIHADSDRSAYNLGDHRLVATLSVRGLMGTAPYLRDGSYARIRDLDEVAQTLYRGYLRHEPNRALALEAFVAALPRPDPLPRAQRDPAAEERGYTAFRKAHCERCHAPPAFTNLGQVPARSLFPRWAAKLPATELFDVPSLLSLSASAPYLNDGRARDLGAVLDENSESNLHGDTRALDTRERRDLIAFLESL